MEMEHIYPWSNLQHHYDTDIKSQHLRQLLTDQTRNSQLITEFEDLIFDYSH